MHQNQEETKLRLLTAAGEVFSEKGFRSGTIREICARAGANVASVNYHFGGKDGLYRALLEHCFQEGMRRHPLAAGPVDGSNAVQALAAYIRSFLCRTIGDVQPRWLARLMAREMADPTPALNSMVLSSVRPNMDRLMEIVAALLGDGADRQDIRRCALSVVGQCQHYSRARSILAVLFPDQKFDASAIDPLTEHIVKFSLSAIRGYRREGTNEQH